MCYIEDYTHDIDDCVGFVQHSKLDYAHSSTCVLGTPSLRGCRSRGIYMRASTWRLTATACVCVCTVRAKHALSSITFFVAGESYGGALSLYVGLRMQQASVASFGGVMLIAPAITGALPPAPVIWVLRNCCVPCFPTRYPFFMPNPVNPEAIWNDPSVRDAKAKDTMRWAARTNGKFRLRTADQLLECTVQLQSMLSDVRFPWVAIHSAHDQAVLHDGSRLLFDCSATPDGEKKFYSLVHPPTAAAAAVAASEARAGAAEGPPTTFDVVETDVAEAHDLMSSRRAAEYTELMLSFVRARCPAGSASSAAAAR